jgi:tetratricopeptide (TPR) repeat protein
MLRRRKPTHIWRILLLLILIGAGLYVNYFIVPVTDPLFIPTPTPTRSPETYLADADALSKEGKYSQAIEMYNEAILSDPNNVNSYISLARAQIFFQKYADAQESAANALLLNNNNATAHAILGWAQIMQEDYLNAESSIKRAIELDPNNAIAHAFYAELLIKLNSAGQGELGTFEKAREEANLALALGPDLMEVHRARGIFYQNTDNLDLAIEEFNTAIMYEPNIAELHLDLGLAYRFKQVPELDKAITEFTKANSLNPTDPNPDLYISGVYANIGEWTKAIQYAEQAMGDTPGDPNVWGTLGTMYYRAEKYQQAADALRYAVRGGTTTEGAVVEGLPLDYTVAPYYSRYGLSLARLGECNEAVQVSQLLLQTVKDDENAVYNANAIVEICQGKPVTGGLPVEPTATAAEVPADGSQPTPAQ